MNPGYPGALEREARRLGRLVWVSESTAAALGEVLAATTDDLLAVELARRIGRHVETAEVVRARLPELREFPVASLVVGAGSTAWVAFADRVRTATADVALGLDDVAAATIAAGCRSLVADASPAGSPTVRRTLAALGELPRAPVDEALLAELDDA